MNSTRLIRPAGLIVVAAVVGFLLARSAGSGTKHPAGALTRTVSAATFAARYPGDWTRADAPSLRGLSLRGEVGLGPSGSASERMAIGTVSATTVGALPAAFLASLPSRPSPEVVALGAYRFDRYLDLRPRGSGRVVSVYLLATTHATIIATCAAPRRSDTFTVACERVLRTLRLARGVKVSGGVDAAYALELDQILATLDKARRADGPGLRASSLATRAGAADRLATAQSRAAATAQRLSAGIAASANATLVHALREAASGYRAHATAARRHDRVGYDVAQHTLESAQRTLAGAFKTLSRLGYRLR